MPRRPSNFEKPKNFKQSFKHLSHYIKPYLPAIIFSLILTITATILVITCPRLVGFITNSLQESVDNEVAIDFKFVTKMGIIVLTLNVVHFLCQYMQNFIMTGVSQNITYKMRDEISKKINKLPLKYFDGEQIGDILSRITNDVDMVASNLSNVVNQIFHSITMLIGVVIFMFTINVPMTFVTFLCIPLSIVIMLLVVRFSQKYFRQQQAALGDVNGQIEEMFTNHTIVKAYLLEDKCFNKFSTFNNKLYTSAWKSQFFSGIMMPLFGFVGNIAYIATAIMGAFYAISGKLLIGDIQSFLTYVKQFNQPLSQLSSISANVQNMMAANERIMEFLELKEEPSEEDKTATIENVQGNVIFENVCFGYDDSNEIIHNFSTQVKAGQKIAIVGPTGAGKTTLISLLMRFYDIQSGDIKVDGVSIYDMPRGKVRSLFGMVLQDTWLFNGTIRENLTYGAKIDDEELYKICRVAKVDHFIRSLPHGYDMVIDEDSNISQGQKQLLTIARAMVQNSPMLILDEATSNVDTRTEELIQEAMDKLTEGRTSFVIAHRLSTIKNADLILVLKDGNIVEQGNHEQLIAKNGFYASLYNSQFTNN